MCICSERLMWLWESGRLKQSRLKGGSKIFIASSFKSIQLFGGSQASTVRNWAGPVVITSLLISTDGFFSMVSAWLTQQRARERTALSLALCPPPFPSPRPYLHVLSALSHNGTHINSSGYWTGDIHHPGIHLRAIFIPKVSPFSLPLYLYLPLFSNSTVAFSTWRGWAGQSVSRLIFNACLA